MQPITAGSLVPGIAFELYKAGQPLAAAIVYADLVRGGASTPEIYCGLGAALLDSRGQLVRKPFEAWAAKVLTRGAPTFKGTTFEDVARERRAQIPAGTPAPALADDEVEALIDFLVVSEGVLPDAVAALPADDQMGAVMALGERPGALYVPVVRAAIAGRYGGGAARSALKRVGALIERADVQGALAVAAASPLREELGPYLTSVLSRLPDGWDAPRTSACPPYQGLGPVAIELVAAGARPAACVPLLCEALGASPRDARSWLEHAPCVIKRGATKSDGFGLDRALTEAGATVALSGLDRPATASSPSSPSSPSSSSPSSPSSSASKPWWKIW